MAAVGQMAAAAVGVVVAADAVVEQNVSQGNVQKARGNIYLAPLSFVRRIRRFQLSDLKGPCRV